jgi:hypothetical protein
MGKKGEPCYSYLKHLRKGSSLQLAISWGERKTHEDFLTIPIFQ